LLSLIGYKGMFKLPFTFWDSYLYKGV